MNVIDKNNVSYNVEESCIGEGAQGKTFLLAGGNHIVKLFDGTNPTELESRINFLINLDLDKEIYSVPMKEIIVPKIGYISEFASGMEPLSKLMCSPRINDPNEWLINSGGSLKRYGVLIKLACALRTLHSKGLVYCDLSPNNVFVSEKTEKHNVFLIDMDNLRYKTGIVHNIFTPRYGAPEVVKNIAPNTTMSDCYSFAVIAYELLTWNHPLIGDMVDDGEPEIEEKALRGKLPWVEDGKDDSNRRTAGLPSSLFVPRKVMELFHKTFEDGLNDPMQRPTMANWVDALNDGLNDLLKCKNCNVHYPHSNSQHCPLCGTSPELQLTLKIQRWENEEYYDRNMNTVKSHFCLQPVVLDEIKIDKDTPKYIKANQLLVVFDDYDTPIARIKIEPIEGGSGSTGARLIIEPQNDYTLFCKIPDLNYEKTFDSVWKCRFSLSSHKTMILAVKDFSTPQRVIVI